VFLPARAVVFALAGTLHYLQRPDPLAFACATLAMASVA
jgi:hypothetical protein